MIDAALIMEKIHTEVDCRDVVEDMLGIELERKRYAGMAAMLCINHPDEHLGSCFVKHDYAHCFACRWHADAVGIVMKAKDVTWIEAVKLLDEHFKLGLELEEKRNSREREDVLRINATDLALIGINDRAGLKSLYDSDREQFWQYLAACARFTDQAYSIAETTKETESLLADSQKLFADFCRKIKVLKKKNKPETRLVILGQVN